MIAVGVVSVILKKMEEIKLLPNSKNSVSVNHSGSEFAKKMIKAELTGVFLCMNVKFKAVWIRARNHFYTLMNVVNTAFCSDEFK